jgi:ribosomal subunit interface protein
VYRVDIVVKGRHTAVPERFRKHVQTKLAKLERLDSKVIRVDAELSAERNPRLSGIRERIELTVYSRGPVIRAEAAAPDPYAALDLAASKLAERLRRAASRRNDHHYPGTHRGCRPASPENTAGPAAPGAAPGARERRSAAANGAARRDGAGEPVEALDAGGYDVPDHSPMVVREKTHVAAPMTLDDALSNMELVGHDFYLFQDAVTGLPSVVYRRCGYDYGVIRLGQLDIRPEVEPDFLVRRPVVRPAPGAASASAAEPVGSGGRR